MYRLNHRFLPALLLLFLSFGCLETLGLGGNETPPPSTLPPTTTPPPIYERPTSTPVTPAPTTTPPPTTEAPTPQPTTTVPPPETPPPISEEEQIRQRIIEDVLSRTLTTRHNVPYVPEEEDIESIQPTILNDRPVWQVKVRGPPPAHWILWYSEDGTRLLDTDKF
jgi:hypothetical protein